jgi:hypothetical protein
MVESATRPYESNWIKCGDRHYKTLCVPSRLPRFVPKYLNGGLVASALALLFYSLSDSPPYAVRVYWVKRTWWKWWWHRHLHEEYATMDQGKAKAREYVAALRAGHVPGAA